MDKHMPTTAFGFRGNTELELYEYLKKSKLSEIFSDDKLSQLANDYFKYHRFIQKFLKWARWYLFDKRAETRPIMNETDNEIISAWTKNLRELYEKYSISQSEYEKILYSQLMNDFLWNPKLDPNNPKIQTYYQNKVDNLNKNKIIQEVSGSEILSEENLSVMNDPDSVKLLNHGITSEAVAIYNRSVAKIKDIGESDVNTIKLEAAKLKYMDVLIESNYIITNSIENKKSYFDYCVLSNSIKKTLYECIEIIKSKDSLFDMDSFYETTEFYLNNPKEYRHVKTYKNFIDDFII